MTLNDVLETVFAPGTCDVCAAAGPEGSGDIIHPVYRDSETGGHYCLDCLVLSTEPLIDGPPDPAAARTAKTCPASRRLASRRTSA